MIQYTKGKKHSQKRRTIICSECGEYKLHQAHGLCKKCYMKGRNYRFGNKKYRIKENGYWMIYKPHFKYNNKYTGYTREHRYIIYIYLSILNNKVTYLDKNDDIHHINGDKLDNRIQNLQLIKHSEHSKISNPIIDRTDTFCNLCKSKTTRKVLMNGKYYDGWNCDIEGHLCFDCYSIIRYYREKFKIKSKYKLLLTQPIIDVTNKTNTRKSKNTGNGI